MTTQAALRERLEAAGQGHVFAHWDALDDARRAHLERQVASLDLELVAELSGLLNADLAETASAPRLEPPETFPLERTPEQALQAAEAIRRGQEALAAGLVGYVLVAGGQGSRLGFEGPKGMFPVGPVTGCSLFAWHAARIAAARERLGAPVAWYVMTSETNDAETRAFFEQHDFFSLGAENVRFFTQAMLPALDTEGRILMSAKDSLFLAPNGHGGTLAALASSGCLADAEGRGIETLSYFQVDNPLIRPTDALFLGLHLIEGADMSSKAVSKRDASEKVGVLGRVDGRLGCIEYSDLPEELRLARDESGQLLFRAGNVAAHVLDRRFVEELTRGGLQLPWHLARKKMTVVDETGATVEREGVKFETFVFDALAKAKRSVTLEVDRAHQFSAVKNAEGSDSPATTRRDLTQLFAEWVRAAGGELPAAGPGGDVPIEVDPRFAEDAEQFHGSMPHPPDTSGGGHHYR